MTNQEGVTILVTGGAGFLGQHIVKELMEQEVFPVKEIRSFDIQPFKWHHGLHPSKNSHKLNHIEGSICDPAAVTKACENVDAVIHNCGCVAFGAYPNRKSIRAVNVDGTENAVNACIEQNVECLVYTSSIEVANDLKKPSVNASETSVTVPAINPVLCVYSQSKYDAEIMVLRANNKALKNGKKLRTCALRPCGMYGEGEHILTTNLGYFINAGVALRIGEPSGKIQYAYAGNIAYSYVLAVKSLLRPDEKTDISGEAFFLGDDTPLYSIGEMVAQFAKALVAETGTATPPYWLMYTIAFFLTVMCWLVSNIKNWEMPFHTNAVRFMFGEYHYSWEKLQRVLGYKPRYTYKEAFDRSITYYEHYFGLNNKSNQNKKQK
ncbi:3 beta-hydroxysteroid dehydrogenase/Delta 5--_4-isomerase type 2-like [Apostichopus japonicus]|uniref:3 beta-hydroxysteroid dehydrogenase/Delta 5-->4-isomerase type 2-like n=1 Tax=Stichopus japonicus TaxID=307972 RepID=UPI003AB4CC29